MLTGRFIRGDNAIKSHSGPSSTCARPGMTGNFIQLRLSQFSPIFNKMEAHVSPPTSEKRSSRLQPFPSLALRVQSKCSTRFPEKLCQVGALELTGESLKVLLDLILT
jgi:hypothetical protein